MLIVDLLRSLPRKRFNYKHWVGEDWKGAADLSCGTTACAGGWATTIPKIRRRGLRLTHYWNYDSYAGKVDIGQAEEVFNLDTAEVQFLFYPNWISPVGSEWMSPNADATAKQVAAHIERFVKWKAKQLAV